MAGYTDYGFRHEIIKQNAGLTFTELVSSKGICLGDKGNEKILYTGEDQEKTAVQIFGHEPYYMRKAIEDKQLEKFKIVDINMGCPVNKIFNNKDGSALLCDIKSTELLVKECVKTGKTITAKIRIGINKDKYITEDFCKMLRDSGVKAISIHARVREDFYSGEPNYEEIYKAKKCVDIPIIANGGIFSLEDAEKMMDKTGADGVMIARGAVENPFIFCELQGIKPTESKKEFIINVLRENEKIKGTKRTAVEFRKFVAMYFKGVNGIKEQKAQLLKQENVDEIVKILDSCF